MELTTEEIKLLKAEIAVKKANMDFHKKNVVVNEEIKAAHQPITDAIMATHKVETDALKKALADAKTALENTFK